MYSLLRNSSGAINMTAIASHFEIQSDHTTKPSALHVECSHEFKITLQDAVPKNASDYITEEFAHCVQQQLVDWTLNSVRSLLFYSRAPSEWGGRIPKVMEEEYKIYVLRLGASDREYVEVLANSNLYREHKIEKATRIQMAEGTINSLRAQIGNRKLNIYEWRQVIEGYLLSLSCEAQTRVDYKKQIREIKRTKLLGTTTTSKMSAAFRQEMLAKRGASLESQIMSVPISEQEMQDVFRSSQTAVYQRLGLSWEAEGVCF